MTKKEQNALYYQKNKEKIKARAKKWAQENPEKVRARQKRFHEKNPDAKKGYCKKYAQANPEIYRQATKKWRQNNPEKINAINAKRIAGRENRTPSWADLDAIQSFYEKARELTEQTGVKHHVDHIIPMHGDLVSGFHVENNLQVIPANENQMKSNKYEVA